MSISLLLCFAAVKFGANVFELVFGGGGYIPGLEMLGHVVGLFSVFWDTSILFSTVATPINIPTSHI